jgi:hypothetical protein
LLHEEVFMEARRREPYDRERLEEDRLTERRGDVIDRGEPRLVERPGAQALGVLRDHDIVRWAAIWGGTIAAFGLLALLGALGAAIGLSATNLTFSMDGLGLAATFWGAVVVAVSLFIGGYVAGRFALVGGTMSGMMHSFLSWSTLMVLGAILAAFGLTAGIVVLGGPGGIGAPGVRPDGGGASWAPFGLMLIGLIASLIGGYLGGKQLRGRPDFRL